MFSKDLLVLVESQKLNKRQLALRATYAQRNAAMFRAKGLMIAAESCYETARVHLWLLLAKNA